MLIILIYLLFIQCADAKPLLGHVTNSPNISSKPNLQLLKPKPDNRGKLLTGKVKQTHLKGLIGIRYDSATGEIKYIYPESDLNRFNIKTGDYILKIEREAYRPCLLPYVSFYPKGWILNLTIRSKGGTVRIIPVKLIDARNIVGGDS